MKILMTTDTVGGVWCYSLDLASYLIKSHQIDVVLLSMGPALKKNQQEQIQKVRKLKSFHFTGKLEWMEGCEDDLQDAGVWIKSIYEKEKPDIIHFNHYAHVDMDWDCPVVCVAHSCMATWWKAVKNEILPESFDAYFRLVNTAFLKSNTVVAPSQSILNDIQNVYSFSTPSYIIPNGIDKPFPFANEKNPILFTMGRLWDEAKNLDLILKAAPMIKADIYIAGERDEVGEVSENVHFLGSLDRKQVFNWLRMSKIFALPVKYEPFGLSFLEAAHHKCTLIGGDIASLREIWGDAMLYSPTNDPKAFADLCNHVLEHEEVALKMGEKSFITAQKYSLANMTESYVEIYQQLLHTKKVMLSS
jgi:glycogen synthase